MFLICWTFEFGLTWQLDWLEGCLRRQPPQPSHWSNKRRFFSSKVSDIVSHYVTFHPHKSFYWLESRNQEINPSNIPHMGKVPLKSCQARQSVVGWSSQSFRHHLPTHLTRLKIIANMPLIKGPHQKLHTHLSQARLSVVDQAISPLVERRAGSTKASSTWLVGR